jgi:GntR family transcriptional regulator, transcriptional repressor for pyruvate dehydrogenase complex
MESIMPDGEAVPPKVGKGRRAFEVVYDKVRRELAEGVLKAGDKLPAERELAESLGFSRAAVREALRALEATGLVQLQKGVKGGAFIQNASRTDVNRSINDIVVLGRVPLRQVTEVRTLLMTHAVQLACERATAEELDRIETNIRDTETSARTGEPLMGHIRQFYNLLGEISGNEVLAILIEATSSITLDFAASHRIEFTDELIVLRRKVLSRLRARDADGASRAIVENLAFLHGFVIARAAAHEGGAMT